MGSVYSSILMVNGSVYSSISLYINGQGGQYILVYPCILMVNGSVYSSISLYTIFQHKRQSSPQER